MEKKLTKSKDFHDNNNNHHINEQDLELLVAYAENRLEKKQDRAVRSRLANEPALRKAMSDFIINVRGTEYEKILQASLESSNLHAQQNPLIRLCISFVSDFCAVADGCLNFAKKQRRYLIPGFCTILLCLLLFWQQPVLQTSKVESMIAESYQTALMQEITFKKFMLPWEKTDMSYGFASPKVYFHASHAFGAGLWSGRQLLLKRDDYMPDFLSARHENGNVTKDKWPETRWNVYFWTGRWCFLARSVCLSGEQVPYSFWEKQGAILDMIQKKFAERPKETGDNTEIVTTVLGRVKSFLEASKQNSPDKKQCQKAVFEIDNLITFLSPKNIPKK
ncbi:MAG: hypothetical protein GY795_25655 [Desulfobacterales bacterium]|nr:hypothetical protein [Desulfobacterales bacterium]